MRRTNLRRKGFTLIELLVVIAIITILAAILFPVFARARANARRTAGLSNLKQIGLAVAQYLQDNDGRFPPHVTERQGVEFFGASAGDKAAATHLLHPWQARTLHQERSTFQRPIGSTLAGGRLRCVVPD